MTGSSWIEKAVRMKNEKKQIRQQVGILLLLALFSVLPLKAQYADEEYRVELGGRLGGKSSETTSAPIPCYKVFL